ncbi:MAG: hypothetical protein HYX75_07550 [Acidobacteria bacterium]|nr:hypothetical protein [Acidobacteriota bacterium]
MRSTHGSTREHEEGSAVVEMIFCMVFVFLLIAFVVQQVRFALDYARAGDMLYYDLLIQARQNEVNTAPHPVSQSQTAVLREIPFLRSMLDLNTSAITKTLTMTAAGGTYGSGGDVDKWAPNIWQPVLALGMGPAKTAAMGVADDIGYNNATN